MSEAQRVRRRASCTARWGRHCPTQRVKHTRTACHVVPPAARQVDTLRRCVHALGVSRGLVFMNFQQRLQASEGAGRGGEGAGTGLRGARVEEGEGGAVA